MAGIHFNPELIGYNGQGAFRFWCQKVLPLVYDDSLSYYELLCKVVKYLNNTNEDVKLLGNSYLKLVEFVNGYFDNLDVTTEVNNKLDEMVESGELDDVIASGVSAAAMQATEQQLPGVVAEQIDAVVAEQIDDSVAGQIDAAVDSAVSDKIDGAVESQIDGAVAGQIDGTVAEQIGPAVLEQSGGLAAPAVTEWLEQNVVPQGSAVVVDESLSVQGAAADALYAGTGIRALENEFVWDNSGIEFEVGGISPTTGEGTSAQHIRTVNFVENISEVKCNDGYVLEAYAYNKNTNAFVGGYRAGNFAVGESGQDTVIGLPSYYKYKIVLVFIGSPTRPTAIEDKSNAYFLIGTDTTLSLSNKAADAKAVGDALNELASRRGLTNEAKLALLNCFAHVAWIDEHGQDYYDELQTALMAKTLESISAVFVQGDNVILDTDSLDDLKSMLTVTAYYDDGTSATAANYTLSGTLTAGTDTITVSYGGKAATFDVTVKHNYADTVLANWRLSGASGHYSDGVISFACRNQTELNSYACWAADVSKTLWSAVVGKTIKARLKVRADNYGEIAEQNQLIMGVGCYQNSSITSLGTSTNKRVNLVAGYAPTSEGSWAEGTIVCNLNNFTVGALTPNANSTFGIFAYNESLKTAYVLDAQVYEVDEE